MFLDVGDGLRKREGLAGVTGTDIKFFDVVFKKNSFGAGLADDFSDSFIFDGFKADLKVTERIHTQIFFDGHNEGVFKAIRVLLFEGTEVGL